MEELHIYDGTNRIHVFPEFSRAGIHLSMDADNTFAIPGRPEIFWAVGISMRWDHRGLSAGLPPNQVFIAAAGADFEIAD